MGAERNRRSLTPYPLPNVDVPRSVSRLGQTDLVQVPQYVAGEDDDHQR